MTNLPNDKFTEEDFKQWKANKFTRYFFNALEKDLETDKQGIVNKCLKTKNPNDDFYRIDIYQAGEQLRTLKRVLNVDFDFLQSKNEEKNEY
jgi:hypothetical protein